ncbi:hypothetical protein LYNGBM3L_57610 [Moorena producens 3L]|uniref:Uncharacterized protein n=1 Tax=Moorena producens 3L TaxID=489825 RepID=F4XZI6_9CYAN|nr:hypothetical protein LYNGBM3L_57610 [Moorena producens 3L]
MVILASMVKLFVLKNPEMVTDYGSFDKLAQPLQRPPKVQRLLITQILNL